MFDQLSGHPMAQANWHLKVTITQCWWRKWQLHCSCAAEPCLDKCHQVLPWSVAPTSLYLGCLEATSTITYHWTVSTPPETVGLILGSLKVPQRREENYSYGLYQIPNRSCLFLREACNMFQLTFVPHAILWAKPMYFNFFLPGAFSTKIPWFFV